MIINFTVEYFQLQENIFKTYAIKTPSTYNCISEYSKRQDIIKKSYLSMTQNVQVNKIIQEYIVHVSLTEIAN
jgi:hypothetical protein